VKRTELSKLLEKKKPEDLAWALSGVIEALYEADEEGELQEDSEWNSDTPVNVHSAVAHLLPKTLFKKARHG